MKRKYIVILFFLIVLKCPLVYAQSKAPMQATLVKFNRYDIDGDNTIDTIKLLSLNKNKTCLAKITIYISSKMKWETLPYHFQAWSSNLFAESNMENNIDAIVFRVNNTTGSTKIEALRGKCYRVKNGVWQFVKTETMSIYFQNGKIMINTLPI